MSIAFPTISNRIRAEVHTQIDPNVIYRSEIDAVSGHPARIWNFAGLEKANYIFQLNEIDGSDNPVRQLAFFFVEPGQIDGLLARSQEQIKVGITPGLVVGASEFTFDGSYTGSSTLEVVVQKNLNVRVWVFTLDGIPVEGDKVKVDWNFDANEIDGINPASVESDVLAGWTFDDVIADLLAKMYAVNPNASLYSESGNDGVRFIGFTSATGIVTIIKEGGAQKPDWRGWDIGFSEMQGENFLSRTQEIEWNPTTGRLAFLEAGRFFAENQEYHVVFDARRQESGGVPYFVDFATRYITEDTVLTVNDFGRKIIIAPNDFITVTLPLLAEIPQGRRMLIEVEGVNVCVQVDKQSGDSINFKQGKLFICGGESISIYKFIRPDTSQEFRCCDAFGNFYVVGSPLHNELVTAKMYNVLLMNGDDADDRNNARLYQDFVLGLDNDQLVDYDNWATGNNKYKWSRANSANPSNVHKFKIPDRRGTFDNGATDVTRPSVFNLNSVGKHRHFVTVDAGTNSNQFPSERETVLSAIRSQIRQWVKGSNGAEGYILDSSTTEPTIGRTSEAGSEKTQPDNVSYFKYVLI